MRQIVYFSTASGRQDSIVIAGILATSRDRNRVDQVTGLLVAGGHRYLQIFEGPAHIVGATFDRIKRDDRHLGVTLLIDRPVSGPSFHGWSMGYHEEPRLDEFSTFQQLVDQMRVHITDEKLRNQLDCFARTFAVAPAPPGLSPWVPAPRDPGSLAVDRAH